jgi:orotidine-5'-phosphate decarboxylase
MHNMDMLFETVSVKGHVCVGLDTAAEYIPPPVRRAARSDAEAVLVYNRALIDATLGAAACYKVQIAYYEEMGIAGLQTYVSTLKHLRKKGALVIADIKRGDIADTARRYAKAHFEGDFEADFVTLSPYMGMDSIEPWFETAARLGKGAFVLMRTSNKGMRDFEYLELKSQGPGDGKQKRLYEAVGDSLAALAAGRLGKHGYGDFGVVVGCTEQDEAAAIRAKYGSLFFLIPGYGAQGGAAETAAMLLKDGNGGVVNASRSILKAWALEGIAREDASLDIAAAAAAKAAIKMRDDIRAALGSGM